MPETDHKRCVICQSVILPSEATTVCPDCRAVHHADCWAENQGCAVYGCSKVPPTEARRELEIPAAYWGQEHKPCPACGAQILAAALRCRSCGAVFKSARPVSGHEFQERQSQADRLPSLRRATVTWFVLALVPCTAPVAAIGTTIWYYSNRADLVTLPAIYPALCRLGIAVSTAQTIVALLSAGLYTLFRAPG